MIGTAEEIQANHVAVVREAIRTAIDRCRFGALQYHSVHQVYTRNETPGKIYDQVSYALRAFRGNDQAVYNCEPINRRQRIALRLMARYGRLSKSQRAIANRIGAFPYPSI